MWCKSMYAKVGNSLSLIIKKIFKKKNQRNEQKFMCNSGKKTWKSVNCVWTNFVLWNEIITLLLCCCIYLLLLIFFTQIVQYKLVSIYVWEWDKIHDAALLFCFVFGIAWMLLLRFIGVSNSYCDSTSFFIKFITLKPKEKKITNELAVCLNLIVWNVFAADSIVFYRHIHIHMYSQRNTVTHFYD